MNSQSMYRYRYFPGLLPVLAAVLLSGCGQAPAADDYFPLEPGLRWQYQVTEDRTDAREVRRFDVATRRIDTPAELVSLIGAAQMTVRHTSDGTDYYLLRNISGTYRVGKRTLIEKAPRLDTEPVLVLPPADELEQGITWNQSTRPYVIHSTQSHVAWNRGSNEFDMTYELAATGLELSTPAGEFHDCVRVEGRAVIGLYADPRLGYQEVEIVQSEWYAPGVGLVRLVREEPLDLAMFKGGTLTFELIDFQHP
ncbi:hypothetical protein [Candidatus Thalassolituus haligoni]|uniref:hypothetical protein n=1 Tax=Candidatus Thalassolituus haligoni TaxID=3100113 RepID=UPI0035151E0A|tara:strand:+ start:3068 stop:3826 length:759 start_codon:yes stop_codon:yes gene_type:complete